MPVDFSTASRNASEYAAVLARTLHAELVLLHVYLDPMPAMDGAANFTETTDLELEYSRRLKQEEAYLHDTFAIPVHGHTMTGFTGDSINHAARDMGADLVVMGMRPRKELVILGSALNKVLRRGAVPVLIVPETARFTTLTNIVLAVDFNNNQQESSFDLLFDLVKTFDSSLRVLHVESVNEPLNRVEEDHKLQIGKVLSKVSFWYDRVESDDVEQGILHFVSAHPADLLVLVARRHTLYERMFGQVHTNSLSTRVQVPLLVLRAG